MSLFRTLAAGVTVAAVAILAMAAPASAHDQLISSSPAEGEHLAAAPENITLTFSGELLVLDDSMSGAVAMVVDASGHDWVTGDIEVSGNEVSAGLDDGMPVAGYQVRWQVISEDGHPISGVIAFTVGDAEPMDTASSGAGISDVEDADAQDQTASDSSGAVRLLLVGAGGAAIGIAAYALYRFLRRPRTAAAPPDSAEGAADERSQL